MKESVQSDLRTPLLFPYEPDEFWKSIRQVIREEVNSAAAQKQNTPTLIK